MIKRAIFSLISVEILAKVLSFAIIIIVARVLGAGELGYWSYANAINAFLVIASTLGLDVYAMVESAKDLQKRSFVLTNVLGMKALLFFAILLGLFIFNDWLEEKVFWLLILVFVGNFLLSLVPGWFFQVQEDFATLTKIKVFQSVGYFFLALLLLFWLHSIYALAIAYIGAGIGLIALYGGRIFAQFDLQSLDMRKWGVIFKTAVFLGGALFLNQIYINTDKIMIANIVDTVATGYYEAGYKLYFIISVALGAVWTVFAPKVTKDRSFFSKFALYTFVIGFMYALFLWVFGAKLVLLVYSEAFLPTAQIMGYFALSVVALTLSNIFSAPLPLLGKEKVWFGISLGSVVLNVVLNFWLIEGLGMKGAILATIASELFTAFGSWWVVRKELAS